MKKNLVNFSKTILCAALIIGAYSCQNEDISLDGDIAESLERGRVTIDDCNEIYSSADLYAGQNILVGDVTVTGSNGEYQVTYNITNAGYCLVETHLSVVTNPNDFPTNKGGNPRIGHFEYKNTHSCVSSYSYNVSLENFQAGDKVYIAAHGVVNCVNDGTSEAFVSSLPEEVSVEVISKGGAGANSYFVINVDEGNILSDVVYAWCLDVNAALNAGQSFIGDVFSSYEIDEIPVGKIDNPENLGAVNWLLNQDLVGKSDDYGYVYTFDDIQQTIWALLEGGICTSCSFAQSYNEAKVGALASTALLYNDFVPTCGQYIVIVIVPKDGKQTIGVIIPVPCGDCDETAWAEGCDFPGRNWATFFQYGGEAN